MHMNDQNLVSDIDLSKIDEGERRMSEIAILTKMKAPELMNVFNHAHLQAQRARNIYVQRIREVEAALEALTADIQLNRAPVVLREKGLTNARSPGGSEDLRRSVVANDPEVQALTSRLNELKSQEALFNARAKTMEKCFSGAKAIFGDREFNTPGLNGGSGGGNDDGGGFGRPRY